MKRLFFASLMVGIALGVLFNVTSIKSVEATNTHEPEWGSCQQLSCGSSEGTKSREKSHYECPAGYNEVAGHCIKIIGSYPYILKADKVKVTETETKSCVVENPTACDEEPTPTPTDTPCTENCGNPPTFAGSSTEAPVCSDGNTTQLPANVHVVRSGADATVKFFITEGDSANIYYSVVGQPHWGNAVSDVKPNGDKFVSYTIHDLDPKLGYDFGIQQKQGCGGGELTAVVVDGPNEQTFGFSYWEKSK